MVNLPQSLSRRTVLRSAPFVLFWLVGLAFAAKMNFVFDYVELSKEAGRWESVSHVLPWMSAEVVLVYLIVRPNTFSFSWARCLFATLALAPWAYWQLQWVIHSPGWHLAHVFWLLAATLIMSLATLVCAVTRTVRFLRTRQNELAP